MPNVFGNYANESIAAIKDWQEKTGYVPNENSGGLLGLIDSFQSGLYSAGAGFAGSAAAWADANGYDWISNNARWLGKEMQQGATANQHIQKEGLIYDSLHGAANALGTSIPSFAISATSALAAGAITAATGGIGAGIGAGVLAGGLSIAGNTLSNQAMNSGNIYLDSLQGGLSTQQSMDNYSRAWDEGLGASVMGAVGDTVLMGVGRAGKAVAAMAEGGGKTLSAVSKALKAPKLQIGAEIGSGALMEGIQEASEQRIEDQIKFDSGLEGGVDSSGAKSFMGIAYDPTTWTDNMWKAGKDAALASLVLGGVGHGIQQAGAKMMSKTPEVNTELETNPETAQPTTQPTETTVAPIEDEEAVDISAPVGSMGTTEIPTKRFQEVFDRVADYGFKSGVENPEALAENAHSMFEKQIDYAMNQLENDGEVPTSKQIKQDYMNMGIPERDAGQLAATFGEHVKAKKKELVDAQRPTGQGALERMEQLNANDLFTPEMIAELGSENPMTTVVEQAHKALDKREAEVNKEKKKITEEENKAKQAQAEEDKKQKKIQAYKDSRYDNSVNKGFLETFREVDEPGVPAEEHEARKKRSVEDAYRINKAIELRNKDIKDGKASKDDQNFYKYLQKAGMTPKNGYDNNTTNAIANHAKNVDHMQKHGATKEEIKQHLNTLRYNENQSLGIKAKMHVADAQAPDAKFERRYRRELADRAWAELYKDAPKLANGKSLFDLDRNIPKNHREAIQKEFANVSKEEPYKHLYELNQRSKSFENKELGKEYGAKEIYDKRKEAEQAAKQEQPKETKKTTQKKNTKSKDSSKKQEKSKDTTTKKETKSKGGTKNVPDKKQQANKKANQEKKSETKKQSKKKAETKKENKTDEKPESKKKEVKSFKDVPTETLKEKIAEIDAIEKSGQTLTDIVANVRKQAQKELARREKPKKQEKRETKQKQEEIKNEEKTEEQTVEETITQEETQVEPDEEVIVPEQKDIPNEDTKMKKERKTKEKSITDLIKKITNLRRKADLSVKEHQIEIDKLINKLAGYKKKYNRDFDIGNFKLEWKANNYQIKQALDEGMTPNKPGAVPTLFRGNKSTEYDNWTMKHFGRTFDPKNKDDAALIRKSATNWVNKQAKMMSETEGGIEQYLTKLNKNSSSLQRLNSLAQSIAMLDRNIANKFKDSLTRYEKVFGKPMPKTTNNEVSAEAKEFANKFFNGDYQEILFPDKVAIKNKETQEVTIDWTRSPASVIDFKGIDNKNLMELQLALTDKQLKEAEQFKNNDDVADVYTKDIMRMYLDPDIKSYSIDKDAKILTIVSKPYLSNTRFVDKSLKQREKQRQALLEHLLSNTEQSVYTFESYKSTGKQNLDEINKDLKAIGYEYMTAKELPDIGLKDAEGNKITQYAIYDEGIKVGEDNKFFDEKGKEITGDKNIMSLQQGILDDYEEYNKEVYSTAQATNEQKKVIRNIVNRYKGNDALSENLADLLANSIVHHLGEMNAQPVFEFLRKCTSLNIIDLSDKSNPHNGAFYNLSGLMELNGDKITGTSSTFIHELVHAAVQMATHGKFGKSGDFRRLLMGRVDQLRKEYLNERNKYQTNTVRTETGLGRQGSSTLGNGESTGIYGGYRDAEGMDRSDDSSVSGHATKVLGQRVETLRNGRGSSSGNGRIDGRGTRLQEQNRVGGLEESSENVSDQHRLGEGRGTRNSQRGLGRPNKSFEHLSRAWSLAEDIVKSADKTNLEKKFDNIQRKLELIFNDHEMKVSEKSDHIMPLLWAMKEIDRKLGLKGQHQLIHQAFRGKNRRNGGIGISNIFHESLAYMAHKNSSPGTIGELFRLANRKGKEIETYNGFYDFQKRTHIMSRRMNIKRIMQVLFGDGLFKSSIAFHQLLPDEVNNGLLETDKFKPHVMILKPFKILQKKLEIGDVDTYSITDHIYRKQIGKLRKKWGKDFTIEKANDYLIRKHHSRGIVQGRFGSSIRLMQAVTASFPKNIDEIKASNIRKANGIDNSEKILEEYVALHREFGTTQERNALKGKSDLEALDIIEGKLTQKGEKSSRTSPKSINEKSLRGAIYSALRYIAEHDGSSDFDDAFLSKWDSYDIKGMKPRIEKLYAEVKKQGYPYGEIKLIDPITADDVALFYLDTTQKEITPEFIEKVREACDKHGIHLILGRYPKSKAHDIAQYINVRDNLKKEAMYQRGQDSNVSHQTGIDDDYEFIGKMEQAEKENPATELEKQFADQPKVQFIPNSQKGQTIRGYFAKRWIQSPKQMLKKYVGEKFYNTMNRYINKHKTSIANNLREICKPYKEMIQKMSKEDRASLEKLLSEIDENKREFTQVVNTRTQDGQERFLLLDKGDYFNSFDDYKDLSAEIRRLESEGYRTHKDFVNGTHRLFASKNGLKSFTNEQKAHEVASERSAEHMKAKGYNDKVIDGYKLIRKLLDKIYDMQVQAYIQNGGDMNDLDNPNRPRKLWGYIPHVFGRYSVIKIEKNEEGRETSRLVNSFDTKREAEVYLEKLDKEGKIGANERYVYTERRPESLVSMVGKNDFGDFNIENLTEFLSQEEIDKRYDNLDKHYPQIKKMVEGLWSNRKEVSKSEIMDTIENVNKLKAFGVDRSALLKELKDVDIDELYTNGNIITKDQAKRFFALDNEGSMLMNRYNRQRRGMEGYKKTHINNIGEYLVYSSKQIPTNVCYNQLTRLYKEQWGEDYEEQFGKRGQTKKSPRTDVQDAFKNVVDGIIGVPSEFDKRMNELFKQYCPESLAKYFGDTPLSSGMGYTMQAITVAKLGLFRVSAFMAQMMALLNVYTKFGMNGEFAKALRDATTAEKAGAKLTDAENKMFEDIGLKLENTGMDTQVLNSTKSIFTVPYIGKFLEKSMGPFNASDKYTRRVAALVAFRQALKEGKSVQEATDLAASANEETNFEYDDHDAPLMFRKLGSFGKMLLQFKKYPVKELEFFHNILGRAVRGEGNGRKELARFIGSYMVFAGMFGVPFAGLADDAWESLFGKSPTNEIKKYMFAWAGNDPVKRQIALLSLYGLPANTLGIDFSRNAGLGDIIPTGDLAGPALGTAWKIMQALCNSPSADAAILQAFKELSPAVGNYYQAATGRRRDWSKGVDAEAYTPYERMMKLFGFRNIHEAVDSDISWIEYQQGEELKGKKSALAYKYLDDPKSVSKQELKDAGITAQYLSEKKKELNQSKTKTKVDRLSKKPTTKAAQERKETTLGMAEFEEGL